MKKLYTKFLAICCLVATVCSLTVACVTDEGIDEPLGPPSMVVTGEGIVVNNAVSVDVPVDIKNLDKLGFLVEQFVELEDGEIRILEGYDAEHKPKLGRDITVLPSASQILNAHRKYKGKVIENVRELTTLHISGNEGLDKDANFIVSIVGVRDNKYYTSDEALYPSTKGEIFQVKFKTPERYSDDDITVLREDPNGEGLDIYVYFPESVRERGNAIRWGVTDIATAIFNGNMPSAQSLYLSERTYPDYLIKKDTMLVINHHNSWRRIKEGPHAGEIGWYDNNTFEEYTEEEAKNLDETKSAEPIQYFYEFTPGTPMLLYFGEVAQCTKENGLEPNMGWSYGANDEQGWYWFPYNIEEYYNDSDKNPSLDPEDYWFSVERGDPYDAWHRRVTLTLAAPGVFDGNVNVAVSNLRSNGATITFSPDDRTYMYVVGILADRDSYGGGFSDITNTFLQGREELWQWFTSSEIGYTIAGLDYYYATEGPIEIKLEQYLRSLTAGGKYHVLVNAVGSKIGDEGKVVPDFTTQNFQHIEFNLKDYKLPEPELVLTPVEAFSPWKVGYMVHNPNYSSNPVDKVLFVANYTREWDGYMEYYGLTYYDMAMMNAGYSSYYLSDTDVKLVNSKAGAYIEFDVLENSAFKVAVMGWNKEGRGSNPDKKDSAGNYISVAEATSLEVTAVEKLPTLSKIEALEGEWTASATISYTNGDGVEVQQKHSWPVHIGDLKTNETLSAADYELFEKNGITKENADILLAEYNEMAAKYNEIKVEGQNRVLCQGWSLDSSNDLKLASPWDLFLMENYNAPTVDYLFHDFGPKWFLQVDANGNVFVPVHSSRVQPLTRWTNGMDHYLLGYSPELQYAMNKHVLPEYADNVQAAGLPVEVSEDGNKMTIKSYDVTVTDEQGNNPQSYTFYPNVAYDYFGTIYPYTVVVVSDVELTRGTAAEEESATPEIQKMSSRGTPAKVSGEYTTPIRPYGRAIFLTPTKSKATVITKQKRASILESLPQAEGLHKNGMVVSKR